jgi:hypothetical protein
MRAGAFAAAALALIFAPAAEGRTPTASWCLTAPERTGPCRRVHGRITAYNGNPTLRIWVVGTHRVLGVHGRTWQESETGDMLPVNVRQALGRNAFLTRVFADFLICPLTRERAGWMQYVCVAAARNLYVQRF